MEYSLILMNQVFIMFLLILVGFLLYQVKLIDTHGNTQLTNLLLYVIMPLLILDTYQMDYDPQKSKNLLLGFAVSFLSILIAVFIAKLTKIGGKKELAPTEQFGVIFTNCGFMAIPLMDALFGQIGVFYCNTYLTIFNFIVWTYGLALMQHKTKNPVKKSFLETLKPFLTPTMICIVLGLFMYFLQIKLPKPIAKGVSYIASMNTPLAMIVSGVYIAQSNLLSALKNLRIYYISFLKCFAVPAAVLILFLFIPMDETLRLTILIAAACPTASNSMLFANRFNRDVNNASHIFAVTTLLSIISLPIVILAAKFVLS